MLQDRAERPFIPRPERLERNLRPREEARSRGLDLVRRHELLGEQRNDRQREDQRNEYRDGQCRRQGREELTHDALQ